MVRESTTPSGRLNYGLSGLSQPDKERVRQADPSGGLCPVTSTRYAIASATAGPKQVMKEGEIVCVYRIHQYLLSKLDALEWSWNMMRNTLNLRIRTSFWVGTYIISQLAYDNDMC